jgi:transposase
MFGMQDSGVVERRVHRELGRLRQERTAHSNRIRSLLVLHNLRTEYIGGRAWVDWWAAHAAQLQPGLRAEIEREFERLSLVTRQIRALETMQAHQVRDGDQPAIAVLARLAGIGTGSAWTLVKELFGWRQFRNRRELAGCLDLAPTPYASGISEVEQGISKAGNKRVRWLMVKLAWSWPSHQSLPNIIAHAYCDTTVHSVVRKSLLASIDRPTTTAIRFT